MIKYETERLFLKEAQLEDTDFFFRLLNSPNWIEFIGDRNIQSLDDASNYIQNSLINSYQTNGFGLYKMVSKATNQAVGICGLVKRPTLEHPDLGYAILPEFEGKGYTSEAAVATLQFAFQELGINTILAITSENNVRSRHLLDKVGMKFIEKIQEPNQEELLLYKAHQQ